VKSSPLSAYLESPGPLFDGRTYSAKLDEARLLTLQDRVFALMSDHEWHRLSDLAVATGGSEAGVSARLRDLRKSKWGAWTVERRRVAGGLWEYRMPAQAGGKE
jgi:hypothetical protein